MVAGQRHDRTRPFTAFSCSVKTPNLRIRFLTTVEKPRKLVGERHCVGAAVPRDDQRAASVSAGQSRSGRSPGQINGQESGEERVAGAHGVQHLDRKTRLDDPSCVHAQPGCSVASALQNDSAFESLPEFARLVEGRSDAGHQRELFLVADDQIHVICRLRHAARRRFNAARHSAPQRWPKVEVQHDFSARRTSGHDDGSESFRDRRIGKVRPAQRERACFLDDCETFRRRSYLGVRSGLAIEVERDGFGAEHAKKGQRRASLRKARQGRHADALRNQRSPQELAHGIGPDGPC